MSEQMGGEEQYSAPEVASRSQEQIRAVDVAEGLLGKISYAQLKVKANAAGDRARVETWNDENNWNQARHPGLLERTLYRNTVALSQAKKSYEPAYESAIEAAVVAKAEKVLSDGLGTPVNEIVERSGSNAGNIKSVEAASYSATKEGAGFIGWEAFDDWVYQDALDAATKLGYPEDVSKYLAHLKLEKVSSTLQIENERRVAREVGSVNIKAETFVNKDGSIVGRESEETKGKSFLRSIGLRRKVSIAKDAALLESVRDKINQMTTEKPISPVAKEIITERLQDKIDSRTEKK